MKYKEIRKYILMTAAHISIFDEYGEKLGSIDILSSDIEKTNKFDDYEVECISTVFSIFGGMGLYLGLKEVK